MRHDFLARRVRQLHLEELRLRAQIDFAAADRGKIPETLMAEAERLGMLTDNLIDAMHRRGGIEPPAELSVPLSARSL